MSHRSNRRSGGFSLVELVIVIVIIGVVAAIALPRMSRGAKGASDAALTANLAVLRNAIEMYAAEHGGTYPTLATIADQLTGFSDVNGNTSATSSSTYIYGPYVRKIPALPVGDEKGSTAFTDTAGTADKGWVYNATTGAISANTTTEADDQGVLYSAY